MFDFAPRAGLLGLLIGLAACSTVNLPDAPKTIGPTANPHYKIGAPYQIDGNWYVPQVEEDYDRVGVASWYGDAFDGKLTANGEIFNKRRLSAAHKTLPLPTLVEVENLENKKKIIVRVNDRGPFVGDRIIDLSHAAADELGFSANGLAKVRVRYLGETDITGLAALPGEKTRQPKVARRSRETSPSREKRAPVAALEPTLAASQNDRDQLADLIARSAGAAPMTASASASAYSEFWVEIARVQSIDDLAEFDLDAANLGPLQVTSDGAGAFEGQSIRIGPFADEAEAIASAARARTAGFGAARIIRGVTS